MSKKTDFTGKRIGNLFVIKPVLNPIKKNLWECVCDCGKVKNITSGNLRQKPKSCGCLQKKIASMNRKNETRKKILNGKPFHKWEGCGKLSGKHFNRIRSTAKTKNLEFEVSIEYLWELYEHQNGKCALTGMDIYFNDYNLDQKTASLDRIDSSKGYIPGNVQWVHKEINRMKSNFPTDGFLRWCNLVINNSKPKGLLYKSKVYLGGNLENVNDEIGWRKKLTDKLSLIGITCLDPTKETFLGYNLETRQDREYLKERRELGDFDYVSSYMEEVIARDLRCIDLSDFVIFKIEVQNPTYGTVHELVVAEQEHKPILVIVNDRHKFPLWLSGLVEKEHIFENEDDLLNYLTGVNDNKIEINKKKWKLLTFPLRV